MKTYCSSTIAALLLMVTPLIGSATSIERISISGDTILYPLPEGFCNITDEPQGILLKGLLEKQQQSLQVIPKLIFALCNPISPTSGYPWGWIGVRKDATTLPQKMLNTVLAKLLKDEDMLKKIQEKVFDNSMKAFDEVYGITAKVDSMTNRIVWADDDSILLITAAETKAEGIAIKETIATSATVVGNAYVYTYLYALDGADPSAKDMTYILINNAPRLKMLN